MKPRSISRLLAGKPGLSRPEKEAIFARVLDQVQPRRVRWRWPVALLSLSTAAAALLLFMRVPKVPEFQARGGQQAALHIACAAGPCRQGGKLLFEVTAPRAEYFAAFSRRADGTILWYFPDHEGGEGVALSGGVPERAVILGPEHPPGQYQVFGLVSARPLGRTAVRQAVDSGAATLLRQQFVVEP